MLLTLNLTTFNQVNNVLMNLRTYLKNGERLFDRCELQKALNITKHRGQWRKYLIAAGFNPDDHDYRYSWKDVPMIIAVKLFLQGKMGRFRHQFIDFLELRESNQLSSELIEKANQITEEIKFNYENNRSTT